jgi:valyl-tRNA synthetase
MDLNKRYKTEDFVDVTKEVFHSRYPSDDEKSLMLDNYFVFSLKYLKEKNAEKIEDLRTIAHSFLSRQIRSKYKTELNVIEKYLEKAKKISEEDSKKFISSFDHKNKKISIYENGELLSTFEKPRIVDLFKKQLNLDNVEPLICYLHWTECQAIYDAYVIAVLRSNNLLTK